jgi:hypothetical protein
LFVREAPSAADALPASSLFSFSKPTDPLLCEETPTMTVTIPRIHSATELRRRWRRQIGVYAFKQRAPRPREGVALGFYFPANDSRLVALDELMPLVVCDDPNGYPQLVGYRPGLVGETVDWTAEVVL